MTTIKSYTDLEQSKKLAEILPLESADMYYFRQIDFDYFPPNVESFYHIPFYKDGKEEFTYDIPCWSLASLLGVLDYPQLSKDKLGSGKVGWMVSVYPNDYRYDSCWHDNPVDACVAMIELLHEQKLL